MPLFALSFANIERDGPFICKKCCLTHAPSSPYKIVKVATFFKGRVHQLLEERIFLRINNIGIKFTKKTEHLAIEPFFRVIN
jgi:hypothetical protein